MKHYDPEIAPLMKSASSSLTLASSDNFDHSSSSLNTFNKDTTFTAKTKNPSTPDWNKVKKLVRTSAKKTKNLMQYRMLKYFPTSFAKKKNCCQR